MAWETWVQSPVESYQRLKKWYWIPLCLTLSIIRCILRVKWSNPGKGVVAIEKRAYRLPSGTVTNLTFLLIFIKFFCHKLYALHYGESCEHVQEWCHFKVHVISWHFWAFFVRQIYTTKLCQLWINSRADWDLYPCYSNQSRKRKTLNLNQLFCT